MAQTEDWKRREFPKLEWRDGELDKSLGALCGYAIGTGEDAQGWYERKLPWKRRLASALRFLAIVATAAAGVIPLLGHIYNEKSTNGSTPLIDPLWSGVVLAVAALFVLFDHFWGYTSAWVRYLLTSQELAQELDEFRVDLQNEKVSWDAKGPDRKSVLKVIKMCRSLVLRTHTIVRNETNEWAKEFRAIVKRMDEATKAARKTK